MNPISYSSRDYSAVLSQIDADTDLKQQPARFKISLAAVFDVLSNALNAIANSLFIRTSFSRPQLQDVLSLIDYSMSWKQTASVPMTVNIDPSATASGPYTVLKSNLIFGTVSSISKPQVRFEARDNLTFSMGTSISSVQVFGQTTQAQKNIGTTDGSSWQQFDLPDLDVLEETLTLTIGSDTYTLVDSFINSLVTDTVFRLYYRSDGTSYVILPGVDTQTGKSYGKVPITGTTVYANYAIGGGLDTNVDPNTITEYLGNDLNVTSAINGIASTGGSEEETIDNAKAIAPIALRGVNYFINQSTGIAIAKSITGVLDCFIYNDGLLSVSCVLIPIGGGLPSADLKTQVQTALIERSPLEEITVNMVEPIYISTAVQLNVAVLQGTVLSDITKFINLAVLFRADKYGQYIKTAYISQGLSSAIDLINSTWGSLIGDTFSITDSSQLIRILDNVPTISFSETLQPEDLISAVQGFVTGIDYVKLISPSSPVVVGSSGIVGITGITVNPL
ncbi:hypothetical protein EHQ53_13955 [Leptospira langatensis]|uniref:Baseplate protein J-like domain-containing protein n=1 Tax=Leptospira langatensis TaxID=2484983 RepID=A0ABY2MDE3_9LEPT|nr:baseplate J/gp47 family protein [Leptospira langatensis]TGL39621.1 hypothetical protein EHQ53_13955 [Leptospira langatensis]